MRIKKTIAAALGATLVLSAISAMADFVNAGFEDGTFNGWTLNGGTWSAPTTGPGQTFTFLGDQGKSGIVGPGYDPYSGGVLPTVYPGLGNYSARVNNYDPNYHFSTLSQSAVWNSANIYFGWAAVLLEPSNLHPENAAPFFRVILTDTTKGTTLYDQQYNVYNYPGWHNGITVSGETWKYSDWQIVNLNTSAVIGDTLKLEVWGADCGWGGHGGYVYVDGFGSTAPPITTPDGGTTAALLGIGLAGLGWLRRKLVS